MRYKQNTVLWMSFRTCFSFLIILTSCNFFPKSPEDRKNYTRPKNLLYLVKAEDKDRNYLKTGWYYVSDRPTPYKRIIRGNTVVKSDSGGIQFVHEHYDTCYLNPEPVITVNDLAFIEIKTYGKEQVNLEMAFYDDKRTDLKYATKKWINKKMGFVVDDSLLYAPMVEAEIPNCWLSMSGRFSKEELEKIKMKLESEMPKPQLNP